MAEKETIKLAKGSKIHVLVSRMAPFGKTKLEFSVDETTSKSVDLEERMDEICEVLETLADDRISAYDDEAPDDEDTPEPEELPEPETDTEEETPEPEKEPEPEQEEIELDEDAINAMSKEELIELCDTTEGLEDINKKKSEKVMKVMIIDALFEEEEEEEGTSGSDDENSDENPDDEWQDDDWNDDE